MKSILSTYDGEIVLESRAQLVLPSAEETRFIEREARLSDADLMLVAGTRIAEEIENSYRDGSIVVLVGPGNNGGDGLVAAMELHEMDRTVICVFARDYKLSELCQRHLESCKRLGIRCCVTEWGIQGNLPEITAEELDEILTDAVVVDALLGTRGGAKVESPVKELLEFCAHQALRAVVAVDLPSGVDADTGAVSEVTLTADTTIAVQVIKRGCVQYPARERCGRIVVRDIGIPAEQRVRAQLLDPKNLHIARRVGDAHKGRAGRVLVIGGSFEMPGAPILSALAAITSGAGIVRVTCDKDPSEPELLLKRVEYEHGSIQKKSLGSIDQLLKGIDAVVIGPGMGLSDQVFQIVKDVVQATYKAAIPLVVDADALRVVSEEKDLGLSHAVITPHPGEAARLLSCDVETVQQDRYRAATQLEDMTGATVVLKGASTIIASSHIQWVNITGNPWMATAGSGDVLAGVISSLLAQGERLVDAACKGVVAHGIAGDIATSHGQRPTTARGIINALPQAIGSLIR